MDYKICLNSVCTIAADRDRAYEMLIDACHGVLEISSNDKDKFFIYYDDSQGQTIMSWHLAPEYFYQDFLSSLKDNGEDDLLVFLYEAVDKSPSFDVLLNDYPDFLNDFTEYSYYMPKYGFNRNTDILGMALLIDGILLSLPTDDCWAESNVKISKFSNGVNQDEDYILRNISIYQHGVEIGDELRHIEGVDIYECCNLCLYTDAFIEWFNDLMPQNKFIVQKKMSLASQRNFSGGRPLFDTLTNADGIREMRMPAHTGGVIRILFKRLASGQQAILTGFIKKSDNEGYEKNIEISKGLYKILNMN